MPTDKRRSVARQRAGRREPLALGIEPLEGRQLLATSPAPALPDLVGQSFVVPANLTWGQSFEVKGTIANNGKAAVTSPYQVEIYASPSLQSSSGAVSLGTVSVPAGLQPGASTTIDQQFTLPTAPISGVSNPGSLYVGMAIDPGNQVQESNKTNNYAVGMGVDTALVNISGPPVASLVGTGLQVSTSQTSWGGSFTVTQQIGNTGNAASPATTALVVLTPYGTAPGGRSDETVGTLSVPALAAGQVTTVTQAITLPKIPTVGTSSNGAYTLSIVQDDDYLTNQLYPHLATQGAGLDQTTLAIGTPPYTQSPTSLPQLVVSSVTTPTSTIQWGQNFQVTAAVRNAGSANSGPLVVRFLLVGTDGSLSGLFLGNTGVSNLAAGSSTNITANLSLPASAPAAVNSQGVARIAVVLDPEHTILQSSSASSAGFSPAVHFQTTQTSVPTSPPGSTGQPTGTTGHKTGTTTPAGSTHKKTPVQTDVFHHTVTHSAKVFGKKVENGYKKVLKKLKW